MVEVVVTYNNFLIPGIHFKRNVMALVIRKIKQTHNRQAGKSPMDFARDISKLRVGILIRDSNRYTPNVQDESARITLA